MEDDREVADGAGQAMADGNEVQRAVEVPSSIESLKSLALIAGMKRS